jgi:hypothetical protein
MRASDREDLTVNITREGGSEAAEQIQKRLMRSQLVRPHAVGHRNLSDRVRGTVMALSTELFVGNGNIFGFAHRLSLLPPVCSTYGERLRPSPKTVNTFCGGLGVSRTPSATRGLRRPSTTNSTLSGRLGPSAPVTRRLSLNRVPLRLGGLHDRRTPRPLYWRHPRSGGSTPRLLSRLSLVGEVQRYLPPTHRQLHVEEGPFGPNPP